MIKRLAVTSFAVIYLALIILGSVERTALWSANQTPKHSSSTHRLSFPGVRTQSLHDSQTRILEDGFVVEGPQPAASVDLPETRSSNFNRLGVLIVTPVRRNLSRPPPSSI